MDLLDRKGISPLIAAVLLIAFTMAIASIFAKWAPQLIQNAQGDTKNKSAELERCSNIVLEVVTSDLTVEDGDQITIQQTSGEQPAGNLSVTWIYSDYSPRQNFTSINNTRQSVTVESALSNKTTGDDGDLTEATVTPIECEGGAGTTFNP